MEGTDAADTIEQQLSALHAHYTGQVNAAVGAGRMDLVQDLADACQDEALELHALARGADVDRPAEVEILELGRLGRPQWPRSRHRVRRHRFWRHAHGQLAAARPRRRLTIGYRSARLRAATR